LIDVDLGEYLETLCLALARAHLAERGLSLLLHPTSVAVEAHRAWKVGLIVSELITNAVRHGSWNEGDGVIEVEISTGVSDVYCRVTDNGGAPKGWWPGRGTDIIAALAHDLGGSICREFNACGATVLLNVPKLFEKGALPSVSQVCRAPDQEARPAQGPRWPRR
jgi:two-component sensor histidine kinase